VELNTFIAQKIIRAQKLVHDGQLPEAITTLRSLKPTRSYDKAYVAQILGSYYWQNEQPKAAIEQLRYAVTSNQFSEQRSWELKRMLADLLTNQQQFSQALIYYQELVTTATQDKAPALWLRIAQLHYQRSKWTAVLDAMMHYEQFRLSKTVMPLTLKLGAQIQLKQYRSAIPTVHQLITLEPDKKSWWLQLVSLELKTQRSGAALSTLELARLKGLALSEQNLMLLAQLYARQGIPERAARVLEQLKASRENLTIITQTAYYWQQAKEWQKALIFWKLAASHQKKYLWNVAELQMRQGQYQKALDSLAELPQKKSDRKRITLAKIQALYQLKRFEAALSQAKAMDRYLPSKEITGWIQYLTKIQQYTEHIES
jgi:tetratricopeptide (TPR) repeat protein